MKPKYYETKHGLRIPIAPDCITMPDGEELKIEYNIQADENGDPIKGTVQ